MNAAVSSTSPIRIGEETTPSVMSEKLAASTTRLSRSPSPW